MSEGIVLIVPAGMRDGVAMPADAPAPVTIAPYVSALGALAALRRPAAAYVLYHEDTLTDDAEMIGAVRALGRPVVEVVPERWDGETHSELSAACRGIIAGFGPGGIRAALALLAGEQASATRT